MSSTANSFASYQLDEGPGDQAEAGEVLQIRMTKPECRKNDKCLKGNMSFDPNL